MRTRMRIASFLCAPLVLAMLAGCDAKDVHVLSARDTYISAQAPTQNFNTASNLVVGTNTAGAAQKMALMNFRASNAGLTAAQVGGATLHVSVSSSLKNVPALNLYTTDNFLTATVTWNTRPHLIQLIGTSSPTASNTWVSFNVTTAVQNALAAGQRAHFAITSPAANANVSIASNESQKGPTLIIVPSGSGTTTPPTTTPTTTPTTSPATTTPTTTPPTTVPSTTTPPTTIPGNHHGANQGAEIYSSTGRSASSYDKGLDLIQQAGAKWTRMDIPWSGVQANGPSSFNWSAEDGFIAAAESRGIHVLATLDYTPQWARDPACTNLEHCEPATDKLDDYAAFAKQAVNRYKPGGTQGTHVTSWEIWNEPDYGMFWAPAANPQRYTQMLKLAYTQIKAADSSSTVIAGALANADTSGSNMNPFDFLNAMYANGAHGSFDALSIHPYTSQYAPMTPGDWNLFYRTPDFHNLLNTKGDGSAKIWATEYGWPTIGSGSVSETTQGSYVKQAITQWDSWNYTGPLFWWSLDDGKTGDSDPFNNYGLVHSDFTKKPAYSVWASLM